ncbi:MULTISPECIES: DUF6382 domain-containing protein [Paenibacillus]|uniref:DUF6382 domain-containing protein n=1 Tax=Paenibacillus TaxID=44249 RepID=UPI0022B88D7C|nr:DUF6382 domain-containing protein [Paenibacillus caseinilyticus]MCZ8521517.1 DUF6382 domain-containing protein [Paenibacillus caseinilyticus]
MNSVLYGLQVDYVSEHGHYMVISSPGGLQQEELSSFQLSMLSANRIPGLLPLQLESRDGRVSLYYNMTGKRMLTQSLRTEKLTLRSYYRLLLAIVEVLGDSMVYMLQPGRYVLQEDFIYCGSGLHDLHLTYLPKEQLEGKGTVAGDLRELASRWIHRVTELQGGGYQELMRYLQREDTFSLAELRELLLRQAGYLEDEPAIQAEPSRLGRERAAIPASTPASGAWGGSAFQAPSAPQTGPAGRERGAAGGAGAERAAAAVPPYGGGDTPGKMPDWLGTRSDPDTASNAGVDALAAEQEAGTKSKKPFYVAMMAVLAWGMVWKVYADAPGEAMLYMCGGATLLIAAAALLLIGRLRKAEAEGTPEGELYSRTGEAFIGAPAAAPAGGGFLEGIGLGTGVSASSRSSVGDHAWGVQADAAVSGGGSPLREAGRPAAGQVRSAVPAGLEQRDTAPANSLIDTYFAATTSPSTLSPASPASAPPAAQDFAARTTLLRPSDATVFLGGAQQQAAAEPAVPKLEWDREGAREQIPLTKTSFVIGRAGGEADWVHDELGVSRLHAEFVREEGGGIAIKDLGSRNGTLVNGEALVPYKTHALKEGDKIRIVSAEFTFVSA